MVLDDAGTPWTTAAARQELAVFRHDFYQCVSRRADALFELCDAVLCVSGPVTSLPELTLDPVYRRGHGAMYDALAAGQIDLARLRRSLAGLVLPRSSQGQLRLAVDVTPWPRPDAECSPQRCHCHRPCRCDGVRQTIPGWPYSIVAALESGPTSWTAPLDAVRLRPDDDVTEVTAAQIRDLIARLRQAGQHGDGDPPVLVVFDAGYDVIRLAHLLADLPVQLLGRLRSDRVFHAPTPPRREGPGRPPRHGDEVKLADPANHPTPKRRAPGHPSSLRRVHPALLRPSAPTTEPPRRLEHPPRPTADHRGHHHRRPGRAPARQPNPETVVAVALQPRPRPARPAPPVRSIPATLRPRTHLPFLQTNPGLDPAPRAHHGTGRPVDLADHVRLHPAPPRPRPSRRPTPSLGGTAEPRPAHTRPSPTRISAHPPRNRPPSSRAETHPPRTRTTQRIPNKHHAPRHRVGKHTKVDTSKPTINQTKG